MESVFSTNCQIIGIPRKYSVEPPGPICSLGGWRTPVLLSLLEWPQSRPAGRCSPDLSQGRSRLWFTGSFVSWGQKKLPHFCLNGFISSFWSAEWWMAGQEQNMLFWAVGRMLETAEGGLPVFPGHGHGNASGTHRMIAGCWRTDPDDPVP